MDAELKRGQSEAHRRLRTAIHDRTATVAVVGVGYVGLPLVMTIAAAGFPVIGFDIDAQKITDLTAGRSYVVDVSDEDLRTLKEARFSSDPDVLDGADIILIAVPTPLSNGTPDLSPVREASALVAKVLRHGRLVVLESTTYPGTTEEVVRPILESSGLQAGRDFGLAYSPERINPGESWTLNDTPKIVSGIGPVDTDVAAAFYEQLFPRIVRTTTPREAEMAKLIENTFRQVNIALVNELAMLAPDLGVDIWEAIEAAATKPFGFMPFWPGPGVGGHCIAIDPTYLSWRVGQRLGVAVRLVEHAKEINERMPAYVASRIGAALNDVGKPINGSRVLAIGVTYKADVNDVRESPAMAVLEHLARDGATCSYHDPYVPAVPMFGEKLESQSLDASVLEAQDCVVILTAHAGIDYEAIVRSSPLVFDARGVTRRFASPNIVLL